MVYFRGRPLRNQQHAPVKSRRQQTHHDRDGFVRVQFICHTADECSTERSDDRHHAKCERSF